MKDVLKMRVLFVFIGIVLQVLTGVFTGHHLQGSTQSIITLGSSVLFILYYIIVLSLGE